VTIHPVLDSGGAIHPVFVRQHCPPPDAHAAARGILLSLRPQV
jgi:hypothetical protein